MIASRREQEAGVVLDILAANLPRRVDGELHRVTQLASLEFAALKHYAGKVQRGAVAILLLHEGYLRAGHDDRNSEVIVRVVSPEIRRSGIDRDVGCRQIRGQLVLQLLFAVGA